MGPNCDADKLICPRRDYLETENAKLRAALTEIAAYSDDRANDRLRLVGSYGAFDEPGAVETARKALEQ